MILILDKKLLINKTINFDNIGIQHFSVPMKMFWEASFVAYFDEKHSIILKNRFDGIIGKTPKLNIVKYIKEHQKFGEKLRFLNENI